MTEKMSREKAEWSPEWLTIREFLHITPVNLFHKEQEEGEKQSEAEQQLTAEPRKNLHVLVRARFTLETAQENLLHVYDFLCNDITYRPGTADTSGGFTAELTNRLAAELLSKRKGNCDSIAALTAVLLRRMGYEAQIVQGTFLREGTDEPVDHAWVYAVVDGTGCYFDPLYGSHFAADARDYCMAGADRMRLTHQWDETLTG